MTAPRSLLDAMAAVSPVVCEYCGPVAVVYEEEFDRPAISHLLADCKYVREPDSPAAVELALSVDRELAKFVQQAQYGEVLPVHRWQVMA